MTNFEKIKSMDTEEMVLFLSHITDCYLCPCETPYKKCGEYCHTMFAKWLENEDDMKWFEREVDDE